MQRCPHCSEALEGLVPICWHCGRAVDAHAVRSERQGPGPAAVPEPSREQNLFDQLWFEDSAAVAPPSHQTADQDGDLETWSTLEMPAAATPQAPQMAPPPFVPYTQTVSAAENHAIPAGSIEPTAPPVLAPSVAEPLTAAPPALASSLQSLAAALDTTAPPPAVEPASIKPAPSPSVRPRWQLPALGLAGVGTVVVALSVMGRPASNADPAAAPAPAAPAPAAAAQTSTAAPIAASAPAARATTAPPAAPAAAPPAAGTTAAVEIAEAPAWITPRRTNYGPDGARTLTLQLPALRDVRAGSEHVHPVLAVRCLSRRTDVFVAIGTSASIEGGDTHTVSVQFDDEAPVKQAWPGSASYQELFAPDGMAIARRLAETRMLRFTFTPFRGRAVTAEFNVQGFDRHVKDVARICGWPTQAAAAARRR